MSVQDQLTIVVADDDPGDRALFSDALSQACIANPVVFVEDGFDLLNYLLQRRKYRTPDDPRCPGLVLLDLNMPGMDGREALERIRSTVELRNIPVVVLTTSPTAEDIRRSYEHGANSFITKPATFAGLVHVVHALQAYWIDTVELPAATERTAPDLLPDDSSSNE